jgi:ADP-ribosyl-[dinitrogen reductase] hydrolase
VVANDAKLPRYTPKYHGANALDGLAVALWGLYNTTSATAAIAKAANLLGDADSTAAIAGQLGGAFYGSGFDPRLIAQLRRWDPDAEVEARALLLLAAGS